MIYIYIYLIYNAVIYIYIIYIYIYNMYIYIYKRVCTQDGSQYQYITGRENAHKAPKKLAIEKETVSPYIWHYNNDSSLYLLLLQTNTLHTMRLP